MKHFGIENIGIYPGTCSLNFTELAKFRGDDANSMVEKLQVRERSVIPLWEDPVTMAVNAAFPLLSEEDKKKIDLVIVATESGIDQEKPISSWVHRYLELPDNCRNFEIKSACYSGVAAMRMAIAHLRTQPEKDKKALVITTDQSTIGIKEAHEFVLGCGAVAMIISNSPDLLELENENYGIYSHEVPDIFRPLPWVEAGDAETSLFSYLESVGETYENFAQKMGEIDLERFFDYYVFHVPFPDLSYRGHQFLFKNYTNINREKVQDIFIRRMSPSLKLSQKMGGVYSGGIFLALTSLLIFAEKIKPKDRIAFFSYGSGSCAEFFSGLVGKDFKKIDSNKIEQVLAERLPLRIEQYEFIESTRHESMKLRDWNIDHHFLGKKFFKKNYVENKRLVLQKVERYYRSYCWGASCQV